jgi:hypothetical protein
LLFQPLGRQAVGDGEPGGVVGERQVLVADGDRGLGHLPDRAAAVGPVGVRVQVALERRAQGCGVVGQRGQLGVGLFERGEVGRDAAAVRLEDDGGGLVADPLEVGEGLGAHPPVQLGVVQAGDDGGRRPERLDPVGRLAGALQEEGDPPERARGCQWCRGHAAQIRA